LAIRKTSIDLVRWRRALRHPHGPNSATVRHVLLTLSTWGNKKGESMFPRIEALAVATGLNRETVRRALILATDTGWVFRRPRVSETGRAMLDAQLHGYEYRAAVPGHFTDDMIKEVWERNKNYVSERRSRQRRKQLREAMKPVEVSPDLAPIPGPGVPVLSGDVPVLSGDVPVLSENVPVLSENVPVLDRMISSGISSGISSENTSSISSGQSPRPKTWERREFENAIEREIRKRFKDHEVAKILSVPIEEVRRVRESMEATT
jgi:hypothetical protein